MITRWLLCLTLAIPSMGCIELGTDDPNATSGSSSSAGGGSEICTTGANLVKIGSGNDGATIGIVSDALGIYWVNDSGSVWHAGPKGVSPMSLASLVGTKFTTIATDTDAVYVIDYATALYRFEKTAEQSTLLAQGSFIGVAVDATHVYVTGTAGLSRIAKQGGQLESIVAIPGADSLAVDEKNVYVRAIGPDSMAHILRVEKLGMASEDLLPAEPLAYHYFSQELAVDATHVYWVDSSGGTISRIPKDGGTKEVLASGVADPVSIAVDEAFVYFTVRGKTGGSLEDRAVAKVPKKGGDISYIAHGSQVSAYGLAVDATNAYWTQKVTTGVVETACK